MRKGSHLHDLNICLFQTLNDVLCSRRRSSRSVDGFPFSESNLGKNADDSSQEDCLPFLLDDDSSGQEGSPFVSKRMSPMKSTYGFSVNSRDGGRDATSNVLNDVNFTSRYVSAKQNFDNASFRPGINKGLNESLNEPPKSINQRSANLRSRGSMNFICFVFIIIIYIEVLIIPLSWYESL